MKALQERLRYLQSQKNAAAAAAAAATTNAAALNNMTPMSPHYQRPMIYNNSGSVTSYGHQPIMQQPHSVHYNPQNQQPPSSQDMGPSHQNLNVPNVALPVPENSSLVPEQVINVLY